VLAEVDPDHEAAAPDLGHLGHHLDALEQLAQEADLGLQADQGPLPLEDVERGERGGAGQGVAGVGVAVEEGPELLVAAEEGVIDPLGGERGRR
jgi:hypothetical protein